MKDIRCQETESGEQMGMYEQKNTGEAIIKTHMTFHHTASEWMR